PIRVLWLVGGEARDRDPAVSHHQYGGTRRTSDDGLRGGWGQTIGAPLRNNARRGCLFYGPERNAGGLQGYARASVRFSRNLSLSYPLARLSIPHRYRPRLLPRGRLPHYLARREIQAGYSGLLDQRPSGHSDRIRTDLMAAGLAA